MLLARYGDSGEASFSGPDHDDPRWARVACESGAGLTALVATGC